MLHKDVLKYISEMLCDLSISANNKILPFGGKVVIIGGDWKQLLPVVPGADWKGQLDASIKNSDLFKNSFKTLRLTINMRVDSGEQEFAG